MTCISSPALDDTQIVRYIEGEADNATVAHMKECAFCSEKATQWSQLQNRLKRQLYRITCPTSTELGDYHLGLLSESQKLVVAQHVRQCPVCRREVVELEGFLAESTVNEPLLGTARTLIARLVGGEDGLTTPLVALRGDVKGPLTLEADGIVIILDLQQVEGGMVNILGQLAADDQDRWTDARVEFHQGGTLEFSTIVDDLGAFQAEGIMAGSQELQIISKDNSLIVISNFEVPT